MCTKIRGWCGNEEMFEKHHKCLEFGIYKYSVFKELEYSGDFKKQRISWNPSKILKEYLGVHF